MNELKSLLLSGQVPTDLDLSFENGELIGFTPYGKGWNSEMVNDLVTVLLKLEMVTFFDDVPNMGVVVPVWDIDDSGELYIETFHSKRLDNGTFEELHDRDCDVPMKFEDFKIEVYNTFP